MHYAVRVVRQAEYLPFLWLVHLEHVIFRGAECLGQQSLVQGEQVCLAVAVVDAHPVGAELPTPRLLVGETQVLQADYLFVQVPYTFHMLCFS